MTRSLILNGCIGGEFEVDWDGYFSWGDASLLVYSITSRSSFEAVERVAERMSFVVATDNLVLALAGNKCDLEERRQVGNDEGEALAKRMGAAFFETSAKTNENIFEEFEYLARRILRYGAGGSAAAEGGVRLVRTGALQSAGGDCA